MKVIRAVTRILDEYKQFLALPVVVVLTYAAGKVAECLEEALWARFALRHVEIPIIWAIGLLGTAALMFYLPFSIARRLAKASLARLSSAQISVLRSIPTSGRLCLDMNHVEAAIVAFDLKPAGFVYEDDDGACFLAPEYRMFLPKKG